MGVFAAICAFRKYVEFLKGAFEKSFRLFVAPAPDQPIFSRPSMKGRSASGTITEPSACW